MRPLVAHAVDYLANDTGEDQRARVKKIDENIFKGRLKEVMEFLKTYLGRSSMKIVTYTNLRWRPCRCR